ncbi:YveK family protein [Paenibacillus sp. YYML68]|uniref:YveK family protein n=1 Tax=Paenibacillus sp. YYML68 TaxID=2909250 RepID=UPI002493585B|nr:Wzz/FepE/Etk N-terminal domain-containing protein [Paenibacillus sp. YYML68]
MELELKEYVQILKKRMWMILVIVLASCLASAAISFYYLKPVYSASTKLIVNKSVEVSGKDTITSDLVRSQIMLVNTYKEIVKTPAIMEKVATQYPDLGLTTEQLIQKVKISSVNDTQVITLTVEDQSHVLAVRTVNAIADVFRSQIPLIMNVDNVMILNEAKLLDHPQPIKPNPKMNIAIAFVVALMVAIGLTFLLEYLDDTIKNEADVQHVLGLPVLVTIHKMSKEDFGTNKQDKHTQVGETTYASASQ